MNVLLVGLLAAGLAAAFTWLLLRSREAALAMRDVKFVPIDLAIIGVVDELEVKQSGFHFEFKPGKNYYT